MTPEEKAEELFLKFYNDPLWFRKGDAKTSAIICVDEIIAAVPCEPHEGYWEILSDRTDDAIEYWQKVKDYITAL